MQRRTVVYSGHVQGVGFRYTTTEIARRFDVVGFVRNEPDGSVQLVAEGPPGELDQFLREIADILGHRIRDVKTMSTAATGEFSEFSIQR